MIAAFFLVHMSFARHVEIGDWVSQHSLASPADMKTGSHSYGETDNREVDGVSDDGHPSLGASAWLMHYPGDVCAGGQTS